MKKIHLLKHFLEKKNLSFSSLKENPALEFEFSNNLKLTLFSQHEY